MMQLITTAGAAIGVRFGSAALAAISLFIFHASSATTGILSIVDNLLLLQGPADGGALGHVQRPSSAYRDKQPAAPSSALPNVSLAALASGRASSGRAATAAAAQGQQPAFAAGAAGGGLFLPVHDVEALVERVEALEARRVSLLSPAGIMPPETCTFVLKVVPLLP